MSLYQPENDETLEALADRLRRLPPPTVPAGLETRLLAGVPVRPRTRRGRTWLAAAVLLSAAAAGPLAVRLPRSEGPVPAITRPGDEAPTLWRWDQALRHSDADPSVVLDRTLPPFEWPLPEAGPRAGRLSELLQ